MHLTNFDIVEDVHDDIWLYVSNRYYNLSKDVGESRARATLGKGNRIKKRLGSLHGKGNLVAIALRAHNKISLEEFHF